MQLFNESAGSWLTLLMLVAESGRADAEVSEALAADWRLLDATSGHRFDVVVPIWCRAGREWASLDESERHRDLGRFRRSDVHRLAAARDPAMSLADEHASQLAWCCGVLGVGLRELPAVAFVLSPRPPATDAVRKRIGTDGPPGGWDWNQRDQSLFAVVPFALLRHGDRPQAAVRNMIDAVGPFADAVSMEFGDSLRYWELDEDELQRLDERLTDLVSQLWDGREAPPSPRRRPSLLSDGLRNVMNGFGQGLGEAVVKQMGL